MSRRELRALVRDEIIGHLFRVGSCTTSVLHVALIDHFFALHGRPVRCNGAVAEFTIYAYLPALGRLTNTGIVGVHFLGPGIPAIFYVA
jgi:hypothetical protein